MISRVTEALSKVKGSMGSHERHALPGVIGDDLLRFGKLPLCLFICIILTAVTVVTTAHHTRLLTAQREQLVLERDALDIEWRNLILEENALGGRCLTWPSSLMPALHAPLSRSSMRWFVTFSFSSKTAAASSRW